MITDEQRQEANAVWDKWLATVERNEALSEEEVGWARLQHRRWRKAQGAAGFRPSKALQEYYLEQGYTGEERKELKSKIKGERGYLRAIQMTCWDCSDGKPKECKADGVSKVENSVDPLYNGLIHRPCPLWEYRLGRNESKKRSAEHLKAYRWEPGTKVQR